MTINLQHWQIALILKVLGKLPYNNVAETIADVKEQAKGTENDRPIAYNGNMALEEGKYYQQDGVKYLCTRDTGAPVYNRLVDLAGIYVEVV